MLTWRDAWWLKTPRCANVGRRRVANRLRRGHRSLWRRRWDGSLQATVDLEEGAERPRQDVVEDKSVWTALESDFVSRVLVQQRQDATLPRGPHMLSEVPRHSRHRQNSFPCPRKQFRIVLCKCARRIPVARHTPNQDRRTHESRAAHWVNTKYSRIALVG